MISVQPKNDLRYNLISGNYQLNQGEEHQLPPGPLEIRITHGTAWVSYAEMDQIVFEGDILYIPGNQHTAAISPLYPYQISYMVTLC